MHYYIDGYNLLFRLLEAGNNLRKQREQLTIDLEKQIALLSLDVTLVFDSHYQEDENTRSHFKSLEIIFTAKGETADEYILHQLKECENPTFQTVVTSDKHLARLCRLRLCKTAEVDEFLNWLRRRYCNIRSQKKQLLKEKLSVVSLPLQKNEIVPLSLPPISTEKGGFSYYLETFEKELDSLQAIDNLKRDKKKEAKSSIKKMKKQLQKNKEEAHLSDLERWKTAFERNISDKDLNF